MKTKLALLLTTMALALPAFADNRNPADFAARPNAQNAASATVASSDVKYVPVSNGKGGTVLVAQRDNSGAAASIALTKSSKGDSCTSCGSSCSVSKH
jgi:putative hemolysin